MSHIFTELRDLREKQIARGFDANHDDAYQHDELVSAASCLLNRSSVDWPWSLKWWYKLKEKPKRETFLIAASFLLAEVERIDRQEKKSE